MSLQYGHVDGKFSLTPKGGLDAQAINDADNIWSGTYLLYDTVRPMDQAVLTGTNFANTGDWEREIKYGYRYKTATVESLSKWGNDDPFVYSGAYVYMYRERNFSEDMTHHNAWAGDTMTRGNWAITVGLSYTKQEGNNNRFCCFHSSHNNYETGKTALAEKVLKIYFLYLSYSDKLIT